MAVFPENSVFLAILYTFLRIEEAVVLRWFQGAGIGSAVSKGDFQMKLSALPCPVPQKGVGASVFAGIHLQSACRHVLQKGKDLQEAGLAGTVGAYEHIEVAESKVAFPDGPESPNTHS